VEKIIPYDQAGKLQAVRQYGRLLVEEYREEGIYVKAKIPSHIKL
jgi:GTP-binding protein HflX